MKYSVDYAEGYLDGIGCTIFEEKTGNPISFKKIMEYVIDEIDYDKDTEKILNCMCTEEFIAKHSIN